MAQMPMVSRLPWLLLLVSSEENPIQVVDRSRRRMIEQQNSESRCNGCQASLEELDAVHAVKEHTDNESSSGNGRKALVL